MTEYRNELKEEEVRVRRAVKVPGREKRRKEEGWGRYEKRREKIWRDYGNREGWGRGSMGKQK